MKYFIYTTLVILAMFLFLPKSGSTHPRNLPLLLFLVFLVLLAVVIRLLKYAVLLLKTKKLLKAQGIRIIRTAYIPWAASFHGRYSVLCERDGRMMQFMLLSRKFTYQKYHFEKADLVEFYRSNRVVFNATRARGATISHQVEVNRVGKQRLRWDSSAKARFVLFDKLPYEITDTVKRENLPVGETICAKDTFLLDWDTLRREIRISDSHIAELLGTCSGS